MKIIDDFVSAYLLFKNTSVNQNNASRRVFSVSSPAMQTPIQYAFLKKL